MPDTIAVIGLGNAGMGDDGIGVVLMRKLQEELESGAWKPANAARIEISVPGGDSFLAGACLMEASSALVVDAADMRAEAGHFTVFSPADVDLGSFSKPRSAHSLPFASVLETVKALGCAPRVKIMGIQPADVRPGAALTAPLVRRMPEMLERIKEEVSLLP